MLEHSTHPHKKLTTTDKKFALESMQLGSTQLKVLLFLPNRITHGKQEELIAKPLLLPHVSHHQQYKLSSITFWSKNGQK